MNIFNFNKILVHAVFQLFVFIYYLFDTKLKYFTHTWLIHTLRKIISNWKLKNLWNCEKPSKFKTISLDNNFRIKSQNSMNTGRYIKNVNQFSNLSIGGPSPKSSTLLYHGIINWPSNQVSTGSSPTRCKYLTGNNLIPALIYTHSPPHTYTHKHTTKTDS